MNDKNLEKTLATILVIIISLFLNLLIIRPFFTRLPVALFSIAIILFVWREKPKSRR